jgi:hypothetical protein
MDARRKTDPTLSPVPFDGGACSSEWSERRAALTAATNSGSVSSRLTALIQALTLLTTWLGSCAPTSNKNNGPSERALVTVKAFGRRPCLRGSERHRQVVAWQQRVALVVLVRLRSEGVLVEEAHQP